jgi:hypothetical protein
VVPGWFVVGSVVAMGFAGHEEFYLVRAS